MAVRQAIGSAYTTQNEAKMTPFRTEATAGSEPCLVRIRCSAARSYIIEKHLIGGRVLRTTEADLVIRHAGDGSAFPFPVDDPAVLRSEGPYRGAVRLMLMALPHLARRYGDRRTTEDQWDELVPPGLVESLVGAALDDRRRSAAAGGEGGAGAGAHDRGYTCDVWMRVRERHVYSEAKSLLLSCERSVAEEGAAGRRDLGDAARCVICMEELAAAANDFDFMELPGCRHAFHIACIFWWFDKSADVPVLPA